MKFPISSQLLLIMEQVRKTQQMIPKGIFESMQKLKPILELQEQLRPVLESFGKINEALQKHPELNFLRLLENPDLSEDVVARRLAIVDLNLPPILEKLKLADIWHGAHFALASRENNNTEWLRHYLISVRTLIETLIEDRLAPDVEVMRWEGFASATEAFKKRTHQRNTGDKISRAVRIQYFTSKIDLGFLGEFTDLEISYINAQHRAASKVHEAALNFEEKEFHMLRLHIGTVIWLLAKIAVLLEE